MKLREQQQRAALQGSVVLPIEHCGTPYIKNIKIDPNAREYTRQKICQDSKLSKFFSEKKCEKIDRRSRCFKNERHLGYPRWSRHQSFISVLGYPSLQD